MICCTTAPVRVIVLLILAISSSASARSSAEGIVEAAALSVSNTVGSSPVA